MFNLFRKKSLNKTSRWSHLPRLELIGLEERITPATFSTNAQGLITVQLAPGEALTGVTASVSGANAVVVINAITTGTNTVDNTGTGTSLVLTTATQVTYTSADNTAGANTFSGISILGSTGTEAVTIAVGAVDLLTTNPTAAASLNVGSSVETLNVDGVITAKGAGATTSGVTLNAAAVTIAAAGDIVTTAGNVSITGTTILTAGNVTTASGNILYTGAVILTGATTLITTGGDITFSAGISGGASDLGLDAGTAGAITGTTVNINNLTITNAASATFAGNVQVNDLITTANPYTVTMTGATNTFALNTEYLNGGRVTMGDAVGTDTFLFNGGMNFTSNAASSIGGFIRSPGQVLDFGTGGVTLLSSSTVDSTNAGGTTAGAAITFGGIITDGAVTLNLGLDAGTTGAIAATGVDALGLIDINNLTITNAASATFAGNVQVNDLITTANPYTVTMTGSTNTFALNVNFLNTGLVTLGDASGTDTFLFNLGMNFTNNAPSSIGGFIRSPGQVLDFGTGGVTLLSSSTVDSTNAGGTTAGAAITFGGTLNGAQTLVLTAGAGLVTFTGTVGNSAQLSALTIASAGDVSIGAAMSVIGAIGITSDSGVNVSLGSATGGLNLIDAELDFITAGSLNITAAGSGTMTVNAVTGGGAITGITTLTAGGTGVTFATTDSLFNNALTVASAATIAGVNITTSSDAVIFSSTVALTTGSVAIDTTSVSATGANITFSAGISGAFNLDLKAGTGGAITGTTVNINNLTITNGASAAFTGAVTVNDLITFATATTISMTGTGNTFAVNVDFLNTGAVTLGNGGDTFAFDGGLTFTGGAASNVGAAITSSGDVINFRTGGVTLTANSTVATTAGGSATGADITFGGTLNGAQTLGLTAGASLVTFTGTVGNSAQLSALTISSAGDVSIGATMKVTGAIGITSNSGVNVSLGSATGGLNLSNTELDLITAASLNITAAGAGTMTVNGVTGGGAITGITTLTAGGTGVTFATTDSLFNNALTVASAATIAGVNITTSSDAVIFSSTVALTTGSVAIDTTSVSATGANITFVGHVSSSLTNQTLSIKAGNGNIIINSISSFAGTSELELTNAGNITIGDLNLDKLTITNTSSTGSKVSLGNSSIGNKSGIINISQVFSTTLNNYSIEFSGTSTILPANITINNSGSLTFSADSTTLLGTTTITNASQLFLKNNIFADGNFTYGSGKLIELLGLTNISVANGTTFSLASPITSNDYPLILSGNGTMLLSGDSASSFGNSVISINAGILQVDGKLSDLSTVNLNGGKLTGKGTVGIIKATQASNSFLVPGLIDNDTLTTKGSVTLNKNTTFVIDISIPNNKLVVGGTINLDNSILSISNSTPNIKTNTPIEILTGTRAGFFGNYPDGSIISYTDTTNGSVYKFTIQYNANNVLLVPTTGQRQPMVTGQPVLNQFAAFGTDAGGGPLVTVTFNGGDFLSFFAYDPSFRGGVRVALAKFDGSPCIVTVPGAGGGPNVRVFKLNVAENKQELISETFAFGSSSFTGGLFVATGDTDGDLIDDIIISAGPGGGPRVQVYKGYNFQTTLNDFFAYSPAFTGGIVVAAANVDNDSEKEVVTGPASNGGYNIRYFNVKNQGNNISPLQSFFAFGDSTSIGGLSIAAANLNGNLTDDLVIGTTAGRFGIFNDNNINPIYNSNPFPGFNGPVRVGVSSNGTKNFAIATAGPGGGPAVNSFDNVGNIVTSLFILDVAFTGGLFSSPSIYNFDI